MLVRFVETHRRGQKVFAPGDVLDLPSAEALVLLQDGLAVPCDVLSLARETRNGRAFNL